MRSLFTYGSIQANDAFCISDPKNLSDARAEAIIIVVASFHVLSANLWFVF